MKLFKFFFHSQVEGLVEVRHVWKDPNQENVALCQHVRHLHSKSIHHKQVHFFSMYETIISLVVLGIR